MKTALANFAEQNATADIKKKRLKNSPYNKRNFIMPDAIRTHGLFLRRETLYPTELQALIN